jgi:hypothetical protein
VVKRRIDGKDGSGAWAKVTQLPAAASQYTDSSSDRGLASSYRVRAVNSEGSSAYSNVVRVSVRP